jgi:putative membrane protein
MLALDELCKLVHNNIHEAIATDKIIHAQLTAKMRNHSKEHSPNGRPSS